MYAEIFQPFDRRQCEVGAYCLGQYEEPGEGSAFYRACILSVHSNKTMVEVFFLDYGNTAKLPISDLCSFPVELMEIPAQVSGHMQQL